MAVVPYSARPPFRLINPDGSETIYHAAREVGRAVAHGAEPIEFEIVLKAKIRPVLLLQDRPLGRFGEYAALQLTGLDNFAAGDREAIREQREPALFYLNPRATTRYGLKKESVVELNSLVRVRREALVGRRLGHVDGAEFRTICERLAAVTDLDLANLVVRKADQLLRRLGSRGGRAFLARHRPAGPAANRRCARPGS